MLKRIMLVFALLATGMGAAVVATMAPASAGVIIDY